MLLQVNQLSQGSGLEDELSKAAQLKIPTTRWSPSRRLNSHIALGDLVGYMDIGLDQEPYILQSHILEFNMYLKFL